MTPRRSRPHVLPLAGALLAAACATAGPPAPAAPPPFQGVRSVVLVREAAPREKRPRDPLDALDGSLREKGLATRFVEVGPGLREELAGVERLVRDVSWRIRSAPPVAGRERRPDALGRAPGELLASLGADAFAIYLRLDGRVADRYRSVPPAGPVLDPRDPRAFPARRTAALALVDRDGALLWFDWGGEEDVLEEDPSRVVNAAEAVDEAVRVLAGEPASDAL